MHRCAWLTDIHLNFLGANQLESWFDSVNQARADSILIGGDISESPELLHFLDLLAARLAAPAWFVLGNHDYYFGSIRKIRETMRERYGLQSNLQWLPVAGIMELTPRTCLVGHDGWADARLGDYERSLVMMNDYLLIEELAGMSKRERWPLLKALGDEAAGYFNARLPEALARYEHVVVLTHVPPFREACWYRGQTSNDEWLPHFTCQAVGQALRNQMAQHPERRMTVLCGHTHSPGIAQPLANLTVFTGEAEYGVPNQPRIMEFT